jgi:hypothetical protein
LNGEAEARKVDLKKALKNGDTADHAHDVYVQSRDIVYVPKTNIANMSVFMQQIYDGFLPPEDLYLRWLWWTKWEYELDSFFRDLWEENRGEEAL